MSTNTEAERLRAVLAYLAERDDDVATDLWCTLDADGRERANVVAATMAWRFGPREDPEDEQYQRWVGELSAIASDDEPLADALDRAIVAVQDLPEALDAVTTEYARGVAEERAAIGRALDALAEALRDRPGAGLLPFALSDIASRLIAGLPIEDPVTITVDPVRDQPPERVAGPGVTRA